jgi:hypothetical protein
MMLGTGVFARAFRKNLAVRVRYRTEINVGFCCHPAIFDAVGPRDSTCGGVDGALVFRPHCRAGLA